MLIHGRAEFVVRGRRIDDGIKEALGITPVESHRFVLLDGLLSIFQGAGHNEAADGFPSNEAACSIRRFAVSLSRRFTRSLLVTLA